MAKQPTRQAIRYMVSLSRKVPGEARLIKHLDSLPPGRRGPLLRDLVLGAFEAAGPAGAPGPARDAVAEVPDEVLPEPEIPSPTPPDPAASRPATSPPKPGRPVPKVTPGPAGGQDLPAASAPAGASVFDAMAEAPPAGQTDSPPATAGPVRPDSIPVLDEAVGPGGTGQPRPRPMPPEDASPPAQAPSPVSREPLDADETDRVLSMFYSPTGRPET